MMRFTLDGKSKSSERSQQYDDKPQIWEAVVFGAGLVLVLAIMVAVGMKLAMLMQLGCAP